MKEDYKLIEKLIYFCDCTDRLKEKIAHYDFDPVLQIEIREEYGRIKDELKNEEHFWKLSSNRKKASEFAKKYYIHSIIEAAAYGFTVPKNSCIDCKMYFAVEEANYKLRKFISYDELKKIKI